MFKKNSLVKGTLLLTLTGFTSRFIGFFYRSFLSYTFGEESVGLYQLIFPVFALCYSLTTAGIETALSRIVSQNMAKNNVSGALKNLYTGLTMSLVSSFIMMILIQSYSSWISIHILNDLRCCPLLIMMSYSLPFSSVHSCICGYYFGKKQAKIPAFSQLIEQIFKVSSVFLLCLFMLRHNIVLPLSIAVTGLCIGEIASSSFCVWMLTRQEPSILWNHTSIFSLFDQVRSIFTFSFPLTANRVSLNLLQGIEAVSIPSSLRVSGCTMIDALRIYGVLTGMSLPCILFPSAIANSVSTMLLPSIAELQQKKKKSCLIKLIFEVVISIFCLGFFCTICFLLFGRLMGNLLFHSSLSGQFIVTLSWICPFLYSNNTLISILNGLGKTTTTFLIHSFGLSIRILSVFFLIPVFGIIGYLWGLLGSQFLITCLSVSCLWKYFSK